MSMRYVIGGRNGLFRPPAFDNSPWHPVGRGNFNLSKQSTKHPIETTRFGNSENKDNNGHNDIEQFSEKVSTTSKTMVRVVNSDPVDISENIILDSNTLMTKKSNKQPSRPVNSIQDKIKMLEENLETDTPDQNSDASELMERRVEWSKKLERNKQRTEMAEINVEKEHIREQNDDAQSLQATSSPVQTDPI